MAQIRVEERRSGMRWVWSLLALIIAAALVWYLFTARSAASRTTTATPTDTALRSTSASTLIGEPSDG
jgi:hypothetical protein